MKKETVNMKALAVSGVITVSTLAVGRLVGDHLTLSHIVGRLLVPMLRLLLFIIIGLAAGQVIEATGWTKHLSVFARPLFRFANLGNRCSAAFASAFISGVASNAMLLDFYQEKKITKVQLFLTVYLNQLPAFFLHLPTTFFIVVPLTGTAGVLYFGLTFAATLLRTACFALAGYLHPALKAGAGTEETIPSEPSVKKNGMSIMKRLATKLPARMSGIAVYVIPIYAFVFVVNANGFFDFLNKSLSTYLTTSIMPVESLSVVVLSFAAEFTSGFAAAGALMDAGVLTTKQTVIALLLGNVIAFPIRALRHQLPRYMGIYSPKMGLQLLLSGQMFRIGSILIVGFIFYMVA